MAARDSGALSRSIVLFALLSTLADGLNLGSEMILGLDPGFNFVPAVSGATLMTIIACLAVALTLIGIYHRQGFFTCASILSYVFALSSMSVLIRNCYVNENFKYPQFVTATHFAGTAVVGSFWLLCRYVREGRSVTLPDASCVLKGLLPLACTVVLSMAASNNGLLFSSAHFFEMISTSTPLCTALLAISLGRDFDLRLTAPLLLITLALVVVAFGELQFTTLGFVLCFGSVLTRSVKSVMQHALMGSNDEWKSMDPVEVAVWQSMLCFVLMLGWSVASEGAQPWVEIRAWGPFVAVLATCAGAAGINIFGLIVIKELGPVAQQVVGTLKGALSILCAVAVFGEALSTQQIVGYVVLLGGIAWYNKKDMQLKQAKAKASTLMSETTKLKIPKA